MNRADRILDVPLNQTVPEDPEKSGSDTLGAGSSSAVRSSGTAMAGGLISQALKAVAVLYVAREFGASDFGSFSFANSINAFLFVLAQFGLPVFGAREVAQSGRLEKGLLRTIAEARLLLATAGAVVALLVLQFAPGVTRNEFWLVAGFGLSNIALSGFFDWAFQGLGRLHLWAALNIAWQALWLVATVVVVRAHASIVLVSFGFAAAALVSGVAGWPWLRQSVQRSGKPATVPPYSVKSVVASSVNLGVGAFLLTILVWTDTIIVRSVAGQRAAGVYAAGNRIALALVMLSSFYVLGAFPTLSRLAITSGHEFSKFFDRVYEDSALLFIPGSLWAFARAPQIMLVVFKRTEYLAGVGVFRTFQVFVVVCILSNVYGMGALVAHRRDHAYRKALVISAVVMLVLCSVLTLLWGPEGAAVAVLASQVLSLVLFMVETRDIVRSKHLKILALPTLVGLVPVLAGMVFHVSFWPSAGLLVLTYAVIVVWRHPALYPKAR